VAGIKLLLSGRPEIPLLVEAYGCRNHKSDLSYRSRDESVLANRNQARHGCWVWVDLEDLCAQEDGRESHPGELLGSETGLEDVVARYLVDDLEEDLVRQPVDGSHVSLAV